MNIEHYILPVDCSNHVEGCGFIINGHFITSGHIIKEGKSPSIRVFGEKINLSNPVFLECDENDSKKYDLAVFPIPGAISELELYDGKIENGMGLQSISFRKLGEETVKCEVIVTNDIFNEGNYFGALTSKNLKAGSSGSPVLIGNKVVGIMTKGNNNGVDEPCEPALPTNFCVFLSSLAIKEVI